MLNLISPSQMKVYGLAAARAHDESLGFRVLADGLVGTIYSVGALNVRPQGASPKELNYASQCAHCGRTPPDECASWRLAVRVGLVKKGTDIFNHIITLKVCDTCCPSTTAVAIPIGTAGHIAFTEHLSQVWPAILEPATFVLQWSLAINKDAAQIIRAVRRADRTCFECHAVCGKRWTCSGCLAVHYCNANCQLLHWRAAVGGHKEQCRAILYKRQRYVLMRFSPPPPPPP